MLGSAAMERWSHQHDVTGWESSWEPQGIGQWVVGKGL